LLGKSENMFFESRLNNDPAEEPDLAEPRNGDAFPYRDEPCTSKLLTKTLTKVIKPLNLSKLEFEEKRESNVNQKEVCSDHGNEGLRTEDVESAVINVSNCRTCILDRLKTC
jgi:hypothetical protein